MVVFTPAVYTEAAARLALGEVTFNEWRERGHISNSKCLCGLANVVDYPQSMPERIAFDSGFLSSHVINSPIYLDGVKDESRAYRNGVRVWGQI